MKHSELSQSVKIALVVIMIAALFIFPLYYVWGKISNANSEAEVEIDVPFTSQAPDGNWYEPWQNACEETSIVMINNFYEDDDLMKEEAKKEILALFDVKNREIGESFDESMETIRDLINEADLSWKVSIEKDPTIEQIKGQLDKQRPIIAPVYAPELDNPHYAGGGPDYHVVVIVGYDEETDELLIHDPGTQFGEDLRFSYEVFMDAIHDLNQEDYDEGRKRVLFTSERLELL